MNINESITLKECTKAMVTMLELEPTSEEIEKAYKKLKEAVRRLLKK